MGEGGDEGMEATPLRILGIPVKQIQQEGPSQFRFLMILYVEHTQISGLCWFVTCIYL